MGDDFINLNDMSFSTPHRDLDTANAKHCAVNKRSGFWFKACGSLYPNAKYESSQSTCQNGAGIHWVMFKGN